MVWARGLLGEVTDACRTLAAALGTDPTLATESRSSARFRIPDLICELARQLVPPLRYAVLPEGTPLGRNTVATAGFLAEKRELADAFATRLLQLATAAAAAVPRADHATEAGAREISRHRLAAHTGLLDQAAAALQAAAADALAVAHPDPLALAIAAMATQLQAHRAELTAWHARHPDPADTLLRPAGDGEDGFAGPGTVLAAADRAPAIGADQAEKDGAAPEWAREVVDAAARWLHTAYTSTNTKTSIANALGIPRADQRLWRGEPTHRNVVAVPDPTTFFPWCAAAGLNPLTDMDRDALRGWITVQQAAGVAEGTQKTRLGGVSAWYREMRSTGLTTFEVPAALPQAERRRLGIVKPAPSTPTVPLTLPQVRALRVAAGQYRGRGRIATRALVRLRYRVIVDVLTTTGIRAEELCALTRHDYHRAGPSGKPALWIVGKGRKERWVLLPGITAASIEDYLIALDAAETSGVIALVGQVSSKPADRPLLMSTQGERLEPQQIVDVLRYLCRDLACTKSTSSTVRAHAAQLRPIQDSVHPHSARHFYAIAAEAHGVKVSQISKDLGHSSVAVTEDYLDQGRQLAGSAAPILADLITAGDEPVVLAHTKDQ
jgi:site-specific recombinase XerD